MGIRTVLLVLACFLVTACTGDPVVIEGSVPTVASTPPATAETSTEEAGEESTEEAGETDTGATTSEAPPDPTPDPAPPPTPVPTAEPPTPVPTATAVPAPTLTSADTIAASFVGSGSELWSVTPSESRFVAAVMVDGFPIALTDIAWSGDGDLFGITFNELYRIDAETGEARLVGPLGNDSANALERGPDGQLFAATTAGEFLTIDPETGRSDLVGPLGPGFVSSGDLAFSPDGRLLATVKRAAGEDGLGVDEPLSDDDRASGPAPEIVLASFGQSAPGDLLIEVDPGTGRAVEVVAELPLDIWGLTFIDGTLYGLAALSDRCPSGSIFPIGDESAASTSCLDFRPGGTTNG